MSDWSVAGSEPVERVEKVKIGKKTGHGAIYVCPRCNNCVDSLPHRCSKEQIEARQKELYGDPPKPQPKMKGKINGVPYEPDTLPTTRRNITI